jgi:hypothetical protein
MFAGFYSTLARVLLAHFGVFGLPKWTRKDTDGMLVPPNSTKAYSKRSRRAQLKRKLTAEKAAKKGARQKALPAPKQRKPVKVEKSEEHFAAACELVKNLIQSPEVSKQFDPQVRTNTRMIYTKGVTLWMLILQRLGNGLSLQDTVSHIIHYDRDLLPENKRVREGTLSENSSGYYQAKKKLPLESIHDFSSAVCDYLGRTSEPVFGSQRVFIIDGTTITLEPTPQLKRAFPPAPNQHGESVWPVAMLMVANEMQSGCALLPQIDPMYGPKRSSEAEQARRIVGRLPEHSVVMADSGFGIFSVGYHSTQAGHDILFRLTRSRYKALRKRGRLIEEGPFHKSYCLMWHPSAKDCKSNPDLPCDAGIEVAIHEVELDNGSSLYLVTTLEIDATSAAQLYSRRYDVEFDIRDLKVTMDAENILAQSVVIVKKELMTSVIAYNLIAQFRRQAAKLAGVQPRRLSFKGVWLSFRDHLLLKEPENLSAWQHLYAAALISAGKRKHPNRSKPRSYPRRAHPRRPKSTKFIKSERKADAQKGDEKHEIPPPLVSK